MCSIHRDQSPADAENNYLRVASSLDMYGVELHKASVKVINLIFKNLVY